jgi:dUTP pyrophosphatase
MNLKIKRHFNKKGEQPPMPKKATDGAAGFDLCAFCAEPIIIKPQELVKIPTGLSIEIPSPNYVALVFARSGLGIKYGITLSNSVGVIDSDYRGEIMVGLSNVSDQEYTINPYDRIAQLVLVPIPSYELEEVSELNETIRGTGGFGSTGK